MSTSTSDPGRSAPATSDRWRVTQVDFHAPTLALILGTGLAGVLNAFSFLRYKVFVGVQTGNVAFIGMGLGGHLPAWPSAVTSLFAFSLGGLLGAGIRRIPPTRKFTPPGMELSAMLVLLVVWGLVDRALDSGQGSTVDRAMLSGLGAFPVGILGGLVIRTFGVQTTTSYQTGTVLRTASAITGWLVGAPGSRKARHVALLGLLCLASYAAGGYVAAVTQSRPIWTFAVSWAAAAAMIALTLGKKPPAPQTT